MAPETTKTRAETAITAAAATAPVLVGFDGSDGGHDALELARVLAAGLGARCEIATCLISAAAPRQRAAGRVADVEVAPLLGQAREALGDRGAPAHVIAARSAGEMLTECAEAIGAGTLVVGAPHLSTLGRALLGSVAERILHRAPCEVAVAPGGYADARPDGITKIAVAFDGTPESVVALRRAEELARCFGASIELLVAEDPVVAGVEAQKSEEEHLADGAPTAAASVLAAAVRSVDPAIRADGRELRPGRLNVASEIAEELAAACEKDAGLLVAGSRTRCERMLLGSVTKRLIHVAPCPVLVVPTRAEAANVYEKILIGYQDSEHGREAMALGTVLAAACKAAIRIATVDGDRGHELARLAREEGADLIVLGSTHRGSVGRVVPGATVESLLAVSTCAVAVAPPGFGSAAAAAGWRPLDGDGEDPGMRVVGVGFDGSAASREALAAAAEIAVPNGAALKVIAVARTYPHLPGDGAGGVAAGVPDEAEALRQQLHDAVAELPAATRALPVFRRGIPTSELVDAASNGVDMMVVGCRRGGPVRRHMHGSVSNVLLAESPCPVLIIPSGVAAPDRKARRGTWLSTA